MQCPAHQDEHESAIDVTRAVVNEGTPKGAVETAVDGAGAEAHRWERRPVKRIASWWR